LTEETILRQNVSGLSTEIVPEGLDHKRQAYLFKEIREFCTPETRDLVCPSPEPTEPVDGFAAKKLKN